MHISGYSTAQMDLELHIFHHSPIFYRIWIKSKTTLWKTLGGGHHVVIFFMIIYLWVGAVVIYQDKQIFYCGK